MIEVKRGRGYFQMHCKRGLVIISQFCQFLFKLFWYQLASARMLAIFLVSPDLLQNVCLKLLLLTVKAGWKEYMHPKVHRVMHLHQHLKKFQTLPTRWAHERKHKSIKRYAKDMCSTNAYNHSVAQVCCHDLAVWRSDIELFEEGCYLVNAKPMKTKQAVWIISGK